MCTFQQARVQLPAVPGAPQLDVDNDKYPAYEKYANDPELGKNRSVI